jgi:hypothetical protein
VRKPDVGKVAIWIETFGLDLGFLVAKATSKSRTKHTLNMWLFLKLVKKLFG